jgi:hypothetical protein
MGPVRAALGSARASAACVAPWRSDRWQDPTTPGWIYMGETHSVLCLTMKENVLFAGGGGCVVRAWDIGVCRRLLPGRARVADHQCGDRYRCSRG